MEKQLQQYLLSNEEAKLIEIVRKVLWGEVQIKIRKGEIRIIKKIIESFVFERDK